jgi:hypothetical protein
MGMVNKGGLNRLSVPGIEPVSEEGGYMKRGVRVLFRIRAMRFRAYARFRWLKRRGSSMTPPIPLH